MVAPRLAVSMARDRECPFTGTFERKLPSALRPCPHHLPSGMGDQSMVTDAYANGLAPEISAHLAFLTTGTVADTIQSQMTGRTLGRCRDATCNVRRRTERA